MRITAQQLVTLTMNVRLHRLHSGRQLYDAEEVRDILLSEHPDLEGVLPPPSYDQLLQIYLPPSWGRLQMRAPYRPTRAAVRPLTDEPLRPMPHATSPRLVAGTSRDALAPFQPPPDPMEQILADLDVLRGDPMAALTYVCQRSRGVESAEAMNYARLTANVSRLLQISPGYIRASGRAGEVRQRAEGMAGARQRAYHEAWAPPAQVRTPPLSSIPGFDPAQVRSGLEALEERAHAGQH
jgi:hypothetical protein